MQTLQKQHGGHGADGSVNSPDDEARAYRARMAELTKNGNMTRHEAAHKIRAEENAQLVKMQSAEQVQKRSEPALEPRAQQRNVGAQQKTQPENSARAVSRPQGSSREMPDKVQRQQSRADRYRDLMNASQDQQRTRGGPEKEPER